MLAGAAALAGGTALEALGSQSAKPSASALPVPPAGTARGTPEAPATAAVPPDATKIVGAPTSPLSVRSPFETPVRTPVGVVTGASFTPIHQLSGTIVPSDLHFERHHAGVAQIDPNRYKLLVHGLVDRPLSLTLDDIRRFPPVTRTHFLECAGNGRTAYRSPKPEMTPQLVDGMVSNAEWTGVSVATILREVGIRDDARWALAEGGDAAVLSRSIPVEKLLDDAILVYAQNGEALRPAAGYPVRLLLPGWEGNTCIKWIRRLELIRQPNMSRDETSKYTDPLANGTARQFSFVLDAKSTITSPTYPARLVKDRWTQISGLAWTGRGRIVRVDVSTDGGRTWTEAELQEPVQAKALTRFSHLWRWDGKPTVMMSRAIDETGYVQPTYRQFAQGRGLGTDYHFNCIRSWAVRAGGEVVFGVPA